MAVRRRPAALHWSLSVFQIKGISGRLLGNEQSEGKRRNGNGIRRFDLYDETGLVWNVRSVEGS